MFSQSLSDCHWKFPFETTIYFYFVLFINFELVSSDYQNIFSFIFRMKWNDCECLASSVCFNLYIISTPLMLYLHLKLRHLLCKGENYGTGNIYQMSKPIGIWLLFPLQNWNHGINFTFPYSFIDSNSHGLIQVIS